MKYRYLNGYSLILAPDSPSAMSSKTWKGWAYEHRVVMEQHLGKPIPDGCEVHHLDRDKSNNLIENLIVLSSEDHTKLHQWMDGRVSKVCAHCGKIFYPTSSQVEKYCSLKCSHAATRRCERPSKKELEDLVWSYPMTKLGELYGVSNNAVKKWCKQYEITNLPPRGYFLRK